MADDGLGGELGGDSSMPKWAWPSHEIYFMAIILILPGGLMTAAYGAIAVKICQCMKERNYLTGGGGVAEGGEEILPKAFDSQPETR